MKGFDCNDELTTTIDKTAEKDEGDVCITGGPEAGTEKEIGEEENDDDETQE